MWKCPKCGREFQRTGQSHCCGKKPATVDEYILSQDEEKQAAAAEKTAATGTSEATGTTAATDAKPDEA